MGITFFDYRHRGRCVDFHFTGRGRLVSLTFILTGFLVADGIVTIMLALDYRRASHGRWVGLMINGVIDLILAALIGVALPQSAAWAIGIIIGVDMLFGGSSLIALALAARNPKT